jgi:hypothetical protein
MKDGWKLQKIGRHWGLTGVYVNHPRDFNVISKTTVNSLVRRKLVKHTTSLKLELGLTDEGKKF